MGRVHSGPVGGRPAHGHGYRNACPRRRACHPAVGQPAPLRHPPRRRTGVAHRDRRGGSGAGEGARGIRLLYLAACSLASAPTDPALVGAVPTLAQSGIETVVAASIPLPDEHGPWIAQEVHRAVCRGLTPAAGLAAARTRVDPADPAQATGWAALACLGAYAAAP
ncbi:MAG: CHAT domain-containing protein [Tetrasphaera sp.]|nr:CHAT domain-containing protein [Tetrasphaera sp.]